MISYLSQAQEFNFERAWATYFGDESTKVYSNAVDKLGNIYLVGTVNKMEYLDSNFIATQGAQQINYGGGQVDGFITKISSDGQILWSTFVGGAGNDVIQGLTIDENDNLYIIGSTSSSSNISTPNSYQEALNGNTNTFLVKYNESGIKIWGSYYDSETLPYNTAAYGTQGLSNIVMGTDGSFFFNIRTTANGLASDGAYQNIRNQNVGNLISKFNTEGQRIWATYYGVNGSKIFGLAADDTGVYVSGETLDCIPNFTYNTFFSAAYSHQPLPGSCRDAFLSKFNLAGDRVWSTYYGNNYNEYCNSSSLVTMNNNVYLAGSGFSSTNLSTTGSYQEYSQGVAAFFAKFDQNGNRQWGTMLGSNLLSTNTPYPQLYADGDRHIYLSDYVSAQDNIASPDAYQTSINGLTDDIAVKFDEFGNKKWGTYYGGTGGEFSLRTIPFMENFYIFGGTTSQTGITTSDAMQPTFIDNVYQASNEPVNYFIAKFTPIPLSTNQFSKNNLVLFPNPSSHSFAINNQSNSNDVFNFKIFDITGRTIKIGESKFNEQINIDGLVSGNYIMKISNGDLSLNYKLVKK